MIQLLAIVEDTVVNIAAGCQIGRWSPSRSWRDMFHGGSVLGSMAIDRTTNSSPTLSQG
jgi:hypothetical protein